MLPFRYSIIIPYLCHILNSDLKENAIPNDWYVARLILLQENRKASSFDHLRLISILSTWSKVQKKLFVINLVLAVLLHYMTWHNILREIYAEQNFVLILFQYSKAFETIYHHIIGKCYTLSDVRIRQLPYCVTS